MSDEPPPLLRPRPSPLGRFRDRSLFVTRVLLGGPVWKIDRLYGVRGTFRPQMALRTIARLGPVRHALAQRAIAGTLEVHAPFAEPLSDAARDLLDKGRAARASKS
jgi:hypothetical protein